LRATLSGRSHRPCALVEFTWRGAWAHRDCAPFTVFLCTRKLGPNHSVDGAPAPCKRRQSTEEHATPKAEIEPSVRGDLGRTKSTMLRLGKGGGQSGDPCWAALYSRSRASPVNSGPSLAVHCRSTCSVTSRERARRESKLDTSPRSLGTVSKRSGCVDRIFHSSLRMRHNCE